MTKTRIFKTTLFVAIALLLAGGAQALNLGADGSNVAWNVDVANDGVQLKVSGPDGFDWQQTYEAGEAPTFSIFDKNGYVFPEGQYTWELTVIPALDDATRKAMLEARESGDHMALAELTKSLGQRTFSGTFRVESGSVMLPTEMPERLEKDQVFVDDVIVDGSLCVGFDCVNGENFGFDTQRLKENNLRIHFDDTSTSGSFPSNDWRIVANDTSNGGASYLAIQDATAGRIPFRVEAGAPANTLYVEADGDVGVKTANPVVDLHVVEGNTPTLRLEQDGSDGFSPQTWDIAGNEANFFIRDVTNGSRLSFRIEPGAPESSIYIENTGNIGLGDSTPDEELTLTQSDADDVFILIESTNATAQNSGFTLTNTAGTWNFFNGGNGEFRITRSGGTGAVLDLTTDGAVQVLNRAPGSNAGTSACFGSDGSLCECGSCT